MIASSLQMITGTGEEYEAEKDGEVLSRQGNGLWDEE